MQIDTRDKNQRESKFLQVLYEILDNSNQNIVQWSNQGFFISSVQTFKTNLLPQYFKHNKYSSFLRQLNKYGFQIKEKQKDTVKFIHDIINQDKRELKKQQLIKKQENTLNLRDEIVDMRQELIKLQKQQTILKQQMEISKKLMSYLFKSMTRFINVQKSHTNQVTASTIDYSKAFSTMLLSNLSKAIPNVSGDLLQVQLITILKLALTWSCQNSLSRFLYINFCYSDSKLIWNSNTILYLYAIRIIVSKGKLQQQMICNIKQKQ
ncbi:unnamed protein product (macronuclear) [Paramecium tetraurelia]|uniref:HSF-type DNA-binding domain-containing protein n=1 Tax=Paramecium tetraurelia TaxID=5888 RepID=A0BEX4_PARTE|nr:uncharacterized protein GSPATT00028126001 [Paramecium tetraurelia]CAK57091.1 unnamed protein product [Paramecium tetraurelia]|eukprot:XP_001424489.1 hypothetical protein (macronuclear) [Paramecium tetraurelia strain d4-2]